MMKDMKVIRKHVCVSVMRKRMDFLKYNFKPLELISQLMRVISEQETSGVFRSCQSSEKIFRM